MVRILLAATVWGLIGMAAVPALLYLAVLGLSHGLDPRCAAPGGETGCASGAFGIALASSMPAFALFFLLGALAGRRRMNRRTARDFSAILDAADAHSPRAGAETRER